MRCQLEWIAALAGYKNMPCIMRNMSDDTLRHRETILPAGVDIGKLSLDKVGEHNGMGGKSVQWYIYLNDLVLELKPFMDGGKLFSLREDFPHSAKHQKYIAVSIEGGAVVPLQGPNQEAMGDVRENRLNPDGIDAVLSLEKKKEDFDVIISSAELAKFFCKDKMPREMKNQIMAMLED